MSSREKVFVSIIIILILIVAVGAFWFYRSNNTAIKADTPTTTTETTGTTATTTAKDKVTVVLQPGFNLKTIPYILTPNDGKTALVGLKTKEAYIMENGEWVSLFDKGTLTPGQGIWIKSDKGEAYDLPVSAQAVDPSRPFTIKLKKGWNAVGNPFASSIVWNPVIKTSKGETTLDKAIEAKIISVGYISNPISGTYKTVNSGDSLAAFQGILIRAGGDMDLIVSSN